MSSASVTTPPPATGGFTEATFEAFLKGRDEPSWLQDRRREAFAQFQAAPWPTLRDEEWRRTDIRAAEARRLRPAGTARAVGRGHAALGAGLRDARRGSTGPASSRSTPSRPAPADAAKLPAGVVFIDLARAVKDHPELLRRYLLTDAVAPGDGRLLGPARRLLDRRDAALRPQGGQGRGPAVQPGRPARPRAGSTWTTRWSSSRRGPRRRLVQETAGRGRGGAPALHVGAVELIVGRGARLRFVNIQNWDAATWHFSRERALVGPDAALQWTVGGLGSRLAKVNQEVALTGQGARAQVNGVMFTTGRQHLAYFTRQDHIAPHTTSDLLYKGGLKDQSRIVWKGMIRVEKDAQRTDAYQKNDNLLLSDTARADSIPGLEIEANDVRCTHGATAGRVDDEMIFYAQSRGVSKRDGHPPDRRGLLRQRLRPDHAWSRSARPSARPSPTSWNSDRTPPRRPRAAEPVDDPAPSP